MSILIGITTYNRPAQLWGLMSDIDMQRGVGRHVSLVVMNDGSTEEYEYRATTLPIFECRFEQNHGKKNYYKLVNELFKEVQLYSWDTFYMLPDDITLNTCFFDESQRLWSKTKEDPQAICLSIGHDHDRIQKPNWTGFAPQVLDEIVKTNWNDLCFMCDRKFFELVPEIHIPESRWNKNPSLGSGVGQFISNYFFNNGWSMYHTKESLVTFSGAIAGEQSMMHR